MKFILILLFYCIFCHFYIKYKGDKRYGNFFVILMSLYLPITITYLFVSAFISKVFRSLFSSKI